jgi:hypothetical protein
MGGVTDTTKEESLIAAIQDNYEGMAKSDLILTLRMVQRGRARWEAEATALQSKLSAALDAVKRRDVILEWLTNVCVREEHQECPETPAGPCHEFGTCTLEKYEACLRGKIKTKLEN